MPSWHNFNAAIALCFLIFVVNVSAQTSLAEFQKILSSKAAFAPYELSQLQQGETVVKVFPTDDQREVAVCGVVRLNVVAEQFLQSFRETIDRKTNPAILEIGRFSHTPTLHDLQGLTLDSADIDDLKECVVGRCAVKLSRAMIGRFQTEVDWQSADYRVQANNLFKRMLLEYVTNYLNRGDEALIEYVDKETLISVAREQQNLLIGAAYLPHKSGHLIKDSYSKSLFRPVETALVWSKMNLGLKPVTSINQITIFKNEAETGPQVFVLSKQLYANHYFDSSIALTTFVKTLDGGSYLYYENRSLADGLGGPFGKIKRGIVEAKATKGLSDILEHTQLNLDARASQRVEAENSGGTRSWRKWRIGSVHLILGIVLITGFSALLVLSSYGPKSNLSR
jgi:hypothetical protein